MVAVGSLILVYCGLSSVRLVGAFGVFAGCAEAWVERGFSIFVLDCSWSAVVLDREEVAFASAGTLSAAVVLGDHFVDLLVAAGVAADGVSTGAVGI